MKEAPKESDLNPNKDFEFSKLKLTLEDSRSGDVVGGLLWAGENLRVFFMVNDRTKECSANDRRTVKGKPSIKKGVIPMNPNYPLKQ